MENVNEYRIRQHIERLFAAAPTTAQAYNMREEMIMNTIERYHDGIANGYTPDQAYAAAIGGIGDVSELIKSLGGGEQSTQSTAQQPVQPVQQPQKKSNVGKVIAIIAAVLCGTVLLITIVGCIAGVSIIKSITGRDGFISSIVGNAMENGVEYSFGDDDTGFNNAYTGSNSYSVPADGIDKIRVEWVSGLVRVQPYEGTDIKLDEMSNDNISEEYALRYKIADGKLTVRFCKKHTWYGVDTAMLNLDEIIKPKELVVSVPRAMLESGEMDIQLDGVSNDAYISSARLGELDANSISGDIDIENITAKEIDLDTVSGLINANDCAADTIKVVSISGEMTIDGGYGNAKLNSTSGGVWFTDESDGIKELEIGTVSGDVTMQLPQGAGFNMMVSTVSGDVSSVFGLTKNGSNYVYGDASADFDIDTVSGDITIQER